MRTPKKNKEKVNVKKVVDKQNIDVLSDEQPEIVQEEMNAKSAEMQSVAIGAILVQARQAKHLKIASIAKRLCIREAYLEALEQGHYYVFPALVYGVGFLRSYATFLELNADELISRFKAETTDMKAEPIKMPRPTDPNVVPSGKVVIKSLFALFLLYLAWNMYKAFSITEMPRFKPIESTVSEPVVSELAEAPVLSEADMLLQEAQKKMEEQKKRVPVIYGLKKPVRVSFVATDKTKIEIRDTEEDSILLSKTLEAGDMYNPDEDPEGLVLKTTNAGGLDVYIDGKKIRTLGKKDQTKTGVQMDARSLLKE